MLLLKLLQLLLKHICRDRLHMQITSSAILTKVTVVYYSMLPASHCLNDFAHDPLVHCQSDVKAVEW